MSLRSIQSLLVTGGMGFIGSHFIKKILKRGLVETVINVDALTYAANKKALSFFESDPRYHFYHENILNGVAIERILRKHRIDAVVHFAAETHVDNSIANPNSFLTTNVLGTHALLQAVRLFPSVHFHHISTDEVYGSMDSFDASESDPYNPSSPYSASKAAADHLVFSYAKTYNLSTCISHCGNNFGPSQHEEKLIPKVIKRAFEGRSLPIYGTGKNVRDWIFVDDHIEALFLLLFQGRKGERYNIGGVARLDNLTVVKKILSQLAYQTKVPYEDLERLITFVEDRKGHDTRYAVSSKKILSEFSFTPKTSFDTGIYQAVATFLRQKRSFDTLEPQQKSLICPKA